MTHLQEFRNPRLRAVLAQCLVALFFLQTLMPMQAHSRIANDKDGQTIIVCTLQGEKSVTLDLNDHATPAPSAAMLFSDLINDLAPTHGVLQPPLLVLDRSQTLQQPVVHVATLAAIESHSRAPPRS